MTFVISLARADCLVGSALTSTLRCRVARWIKPTVSKTYSDMSKISFNFRVKFYHRHKRNAKIHGISTVKEMIVAIHAMSFENSNLI